MTEFGNENRHALFPNLPFFKYKVNRCYAVIEITDK